MLRFSANLTFLFTELPFIDRFGAAARAGFKAVEFAFPYDYPCEQLKEELARHNLKAVLFNLPAGNWTGGDRGIAVDPLRREEFKAAVQKAISYATALGVRQVNCLVGKKLPGATYDRQRGALVRNLRLAADMLAAAGLRLLVEPINFFDMPGFYLNSPKQGLKLLAAIGHPNIYLQYDVYHAQRVEGELINTLQANMARIGHIQIADTPGRHQPGTGEINYRAVLAAIDNAGYDGHVGLEYIPLPNTAASLAWVREHGYSL